MEKDGIKTETYEFWDGGDAIRFLQRKLWKGDGTKTEFQGVIVIVEKE
jgi:hypothetical protein